MVLGEKIKYYRELNYLTQDELAKLSGLSKNSIYNYENNKREPSLYNTEKIASALNIDINELLSDDERVVLPKKQVFLDESIKKQMDIIQKQMSMVQIPQIPPGLEQAIQVYQNIGKQINAVNGIAKRPDHPMLDKATELALENNYYNDSEQVTDEDENNSDLISEINTHLELMDEELLKVILVMVKKMSK
jgi:transcriptional regulator with XRE-family HTH domain